MSLDKTAAHRLCRQIITQAGESGKRQLQLTDDEVRALTQLLNLAEKIHPSAPTPLIATISLLFGADAIRNEWIPKLERLVAEEETDRHRN